MIIAIGPDHGGFHLHFKATVMVRAIENVTRMKAPEVLPGKVFNRSRDVRV